MLEETERINMVTLKIKIVNWTDLRVSEHLLNIRFQADMRKQKPLMTILLTLNLILQSEPYQNPDSYLRLLILQCITIYN